MAPCNLQARFHALNNSWRCRAQFRRAAAVRPVVVPTAAAATAEHHASLPPSLEKWKRECLVQVRVGFGERGRGLFFAPPAGPAPAPAPEPPGAPSDPPTPQRREASQPQPPPQQQREAPDLVRVPLSCGLALVAEGGPVWLQRELLAEWQSQQGVRLPDPLVTLLEATQRPPALRLAAWLLWASRVCEAAPAPPPGGPGGTPGSAGGEAPPQQGPAAAAAAATGAAEAGTPSLVEASGLQPLLPAQQPPTSVQPEASAPGRCSPLADYALHVMPPPSAGASCLRLADGEVRRLPADARAALRDVRAQVTSYISELRREGLDWGLGDAALWWAFDMVASRSFAAAAPLPPPPSPPPAAAPIGGSGAATVPNLSPSPAAPFPPPPPPPPRPQSNAAAAAANVTLALYVPWACLLNHSPSPNAEFRVDLGRRLFRVLPRQRYYSHSYPHAPTPNLSPGPGPACISSISIPAGDELCISYGGELDNVQLVIKYGFCTAGNANDRLQLPPELAAAARGLRRQALCSAAEQVADGLSRAEGGGAEGSLEQRRTRVFSALASLLQPVVLPSGSASVNDACQPESGFAGLLSWSASSATNPESFGSEDMALPSPIPVSVQLPFSACLDALREERKLLAAALHRLLAIYGSMASPWG